MTITYTHPDACPSCQPDGGTYDTDQRWWLDSYGACAGCGIRWLRCSAPECPHVYATSPGRGKLNAWCLGCQPWTIEDEYRRRYELVAHLEPKLRRYWSDLTTVTLRESLAEIRTKMPEGAAEFNADLEIELAYREHYACMNCGMLRDSSPGWIGCQDHLGASCRNWTGTS